MSQPLADPKSTEPRIVVVGDTVLDRYHVGIASRLDQTAPIPVIVLHKDLVSPGGGANAANNLAHLVVPVAFVSAVGDDAGGAAFLNTPTLITQTNYVAKVPGYNTAQKHRVYDGSRLVARYDEQANTISCSDAVIAQFDACVADAPVMAILVSDYNFGACSEPVIYHVMRWASKNNVKVIVDPTPTHTGLYAGAHIITPCEAEARVLHPDVELSHLANAVRESEDVHHCVLTCGSKGMIVDGTPPTIIPACPAAVVDTCGAGDTVAAVLTYGVACGLPLHETITMANIAGSVSVELTGASPVSLWQLHQRIAQLHGSEYKIIPLEQMQLLRLSVNMVKHTFGVANGVFDMLHAGHISMLEQAARYCDFLTVLVNSDDSAERIKRRPMQPVDERCRALAALPFVSAVQVFSGDTPEPEICALEPDVLIKGPDYLGKEVPGASVLERWGGRLIITEKVVNMSTTQLIEQLKQRADADNSKTTSSP